MRNLLKIFLLSAVFFSALLFWWRPAPDLVAVKPVNWQQEFHEAVVSPKGFNAFGFNRAKNAKLTLDEFIKKETKDRLITLESKDLQSWVQKQVADPSFDLNKATYFHLNNPLLPEITFPYGYIKVIGNGLTSYINVDKLGADELGKKMIPKGLRYPSRNTGIILFCMAFLFILINKAQKKTRDLVNQSTAATGTKVFMGILVGGIALVIMPFFYSWYHDAPPFVFMGGFIAICGIIGLSIFGWQVVFAENLINGKDLLAHWSFSPEEWGVFTEKEYKVEQTEKKGLFAVVSVITLFVGIVFWIIVHNKAGGVVFLVLLGVIVILYFVAVIVPWLTYRRNKKQTGEIFIGKDGLYLNGSVHIWRLLGARLENVDELQKPFHCLGITYSYLVMAGRMLYFYRTNADIRVPIPKGKEHDAQQIVKKFKDLTSQRKKSKKRKK